MSEENKNEVLKNENYGTHESEAISPICQKNCKVCSSGLIEKIHLMRKNGRQYADIVATLKTDNNFDISEASLSRHFQNYREHQQLISAKIMNSEIVEEATKQALHTKQIVKLIDSAILDLQIRADSGNLHFDVSDLDKLMKLRYQVLAGENVNETDIMAIFQKATDKYGFNVNQGVLFKTRRNEAVA